MPEKGIRNNEEEEEEEELRSASYLYTDGYKFTYY
jgi:hypothetical protein